MKKHMYIAGAALSFLFAFVTLTNATSTNASVPVLHAPRVVRQLFHGASTNWSGYAVETSLTGPQSNAATLVNGSWVVPSVTCGRQAGYSSVWVGLDGYSDNSVEQTGTEQDCSRGRASYYAWFEMYPQNSYMIRMGVAAGNVINASVKYVSGNSYLLTLANQTTGQTFTITRTLSGTLRQSAEWVVEAPSSYSGVLPLANFGTARLSNSHATLNGNPGTIANASWQNDPITMVTNSGTPKATPSVLSSDGSSFSVTWNHN